MSEPQTIEEYLVALNASLEVGLRSRRRIFLEVSNHLRQAAERERRAGASPEQAQQRAVAAFGTPEEVAARFASGLLGELDRQLTVASRRAGIWLSGHPAHAALARMLPWVLIGTLIAAVGAAFGGQADPSTVLGIFLGSGTVWSWMRKKESRALQFRPERVVVRQPVARPRGRWKLEPMTGGPTWSFQLFLASGLCSVFMQMLAPTTDRWPGWAWLGCMVGALCAAGYLTARLPYAISRSYAGATDKDRRRVWAVDHPWWAALLEVWFCPLGMLALLVVCPAPLDLRVALAAVLVAIAALLVVAERLAQSRIESDAERGREW